MVEPHSQQSAAGEFAFMRSAEIFVANAYTVLALPASATLGSHKPRIVELRWVEQVTVKMIFQNDTFKQLNNSSLAVFHNHFFFFPLWEGGESNPVAEFR